MVLNVTNLLIAAKGRKLNVCVRDGALRRPPAVTI
jgi:hypothetical protein